MMRDDAAPADSDSSNPTPAAPQHALLAGDRCTAWLEAEVLQADPGHARLQMTIRPEMTNGFDIIHGGMVFALADSCFAMAGNDPAGAAETITVASGADITFLAPARTGEVLIAEAVEVARTGRSGVYDVTVRRDQDLIAVFRGRARSLTAPKDS